MTAAEPEGGRMSAPAPRQCTADGCDRPVKVRGLCTLHYSRHRRFHPGRPECGVDGCDRRAVTLGWCPAHYMRWRRHGSPLAVCDGSSHGHCRGGRKSPTHHSWEAMIAACTRPSSRGYEYVGARGIRVCDRWSGSHGFENFLADMRERPPGRVLRRIDPVGDYTPENCRWEARRG